MKPCLPSILCGCLVALSSATTTAQNSPVESQFFEAKIRPLLVDRCYECHSGNAKHVKAGLRLDSREAMIRGGDSGPALIAGKPGESLLIASVRYESNEMPPNEKLTDSQIDALTKWVKMGAPWPAEIPPATTASEGDYDWHNALRHWAYAPVQRPSPPATMKGDRVRNPIDQFVVARLRESGLKQPAPASAAVFTRRVFIDLIGLPPTRDELRHWVGRLDRSPGRGLDDEAVSQLVDSLMARHQYGERWGRFWLDVARYSDVGGWTQDNRPHPQAWRYRDWVVDALNADMPYNEFVRRQIVGDKENRDAAVGTGFFALGPTYSSDGGDPESTAQAKSETLDDRVDTFSRAFLGLTVSCARCHDHKFDPIPIDDYYSIAGVFNNTREGETPLVEGEIVRRFHEAQQPIDELNQRIKQTRQNASQQKRSVSDEEKEQIKQWQEEVKALKAAAPPKYAFAHTIHDSGDADMNVALRGNLLKPGAPAPRRFLRLIAGQKRRHFTEGSGRAELADAVVDPANPLTARVIVNRVWMHHFGRALVRTPNNFGVLGEKPTHPRLLDWLAAEFVESGWSFKSLHRMIMTSAAYRASSAFDSSGFAVDGDNRLLWRMNPRRMDVETWRDSLLLVTGELDCTLGGPPINNIVGSNRRTLYAKISRNDPFASDQFLRLFDFPIPRASSGKRTNNIIPQQFLFMMNSSFMIDRAAALARRLQWQVGTPPAVAVDSAYQRLYGRSPSGVELQAADRFLNTPVRADQPNRWQQYCQVLLSSNEFMYVR